MPTHFRVLPLDRTTIKTRLRLHPDLLDNPTTYIRKHDLPIRTSKPSNGRSKRGPTRNLTLHVLIYKGIKVELRKVASDPLTDVTIHFNPGNCLRNHNGSVLSLAEFLDALAILVNNLAPLLNDPEDWIDLAPGLRFGGVAYWDCVEVHFQFADPNGKLFAAFRQVVPEKPQIPVRHWPTSIRIGSHNSDRLLRIYSKAPEMVARGKLDPKRLSDYQHILRLEMRLHGVKAIDYLGNDRNVEIIDGVERLVRFYPGDLVHGHRTCFSGLRGVFRTDEPLEPMKPGDQLTPLGRLLARVALGPRCSQTYLKLVEHLRFYTGASSKTMGSIKAAGVEELSRLSTISKDELFSDAAYRTRHSVWNEEREEKVLHDAEDAFVHPLIYKAYRPPDLPFKPVIQFPEYLRVCPPSESADTSHE